MACLHKVLAFITEHICLAERIASVAILHDAMRVLAMSETLCMTYFLQHYTKQLTIAMRTIGRENSYADAKATGKSHYAAMRPVAEVIQSNVGLRETYDNG